MKKKSWLNFFKPSCWIWDFDEVHIDRVGNVVGRVGNGPVVIHFDSHMDTVAVSDAEEWTAPPFEAKGS